MYKLTLTHAERSAIDWIGNRYAHGDDLYELLIACVQTSNAPDDGDDIWGSVYDITFQIPEHVAWVIREIVERDNLACFAPELVDKMRDFCDTIV